MTLSLATLDTVLAEQADGLELTIHGLPDPAAGADARGEIARLVIHRKGKANAMNRALMTRFVAMVDGLAARPAMRALVVTGTDAIFVGGADIDEMSGLDAPGGRAFITQVHQCCDSLRRAPFPVIAAVNGLTLGAGLELAAAADMRVAVTSARFGMPEVRLGIPSVVEAALLPGLVGWGATRQMLLLGDLFDAAEALRIGFVEKVVEPAALAAQVDAWLGSLMASGPAAVRDQKALIRRWEQLPLAEAVSAGIDAFSASWRTPEPARMMQAWQAERQARKQRR
ncbi:MAG: enoyl-CoA hydratase-related protein [Burkholderiaceae bacterium]